RVELKNEVKNRRWTINIEDGKLIDIDENRENRGGVGSMDFVAHYITVKNEKEAESLIKLLKRAIKKAKEDKKIIKRIKEII
ncbi:hypothetical protein LCGC14_3084690, partial [marine sediment metagenome]